MAGKSSRKRMAGESSRKRNQGGTTAEDAGTAAAGEAKSLYMFFSNACGPMVHTLYAVDIPHPLSDPPTDCSVEPEPKLLSPVLELSREKYPQDMRCIELNSKFYLLGGVIIQDVAHSYPRDVYIFNPKITNEKNRRRLKRGPPMKTGKIDPQVFVADHKIYVLSIIKTEDLSLFEMFDPQYVAADGSRKWIELKPPPFEGCPSGHAVINRKVFVLTASFDLFYYHLDLTEWFRVHNDYPRFHMRAEFVEDTLYCVYCYGENVLSFGPLPSGSPSSEEELFHYKNEAVLMPELTAPQIPDLSPSRSLRHIGNRRFCWVMAGSPPDPEFPEEEHPELRYVSLTVFEALKDTYTAGDSTFFNGKILYSAHFVIKTSDAFGSFLLDCFALPYLVSKALNSMAKKKSTKKNKQKTSKQRREQGQGAEQGQVRVSTGQCEEGFKKVEEIEELEDDQGQCEEGFKQVEEIEELEDD